MDRPILYANEQGRSYDFLTGFREALYAFGVALEDLFGTSDSVVTGLSASASSDLTIAIAAGRIYKQTTVDGSEYGTIGSDSRTTVQQGMADAQTLTFVTSGMSSGQSQYALVQAAFEQSDDVPDDDPNSGILQYYNADDPENSLVGPDGDGTAESTRRYGKCALSIKYGTAATSGSEAAPEVDSGYVPLYLIDLSYGQTTITTAEIVTHDDAPFLAGLLSSHHSGGAGQAPQIDLTSEVQGELPSANLPTIPLTKLPSIPLSKLPASSDDTTGGISTIYACSGDPNGSLAGTAATDGTSPPDMCWDTENGILYVCTSTGTATTAVWTSVLANVEQYISFTANDTSTKSMSTTWTSKTVTLPDARTVKVTFTGNVTITEKEYYFQLYVDSTAVEGAWAEASCSSGGSEDNLHACIHIVAGISGLTAGEHVFAIKYGASASGGSITFDGGGAFIVETCNLLS